MRGAAFLLAALAGVVGLSTIRAIAQVQPLRVEDIVATHSFSDWSVRFSPDSTRVAYATKDNRKIGLIAIEQLLLTGVPFNGLASDIYVVQVKTGEVANLTGGTGNNWAPAWSPDGRYLAFLSDRDSSGQAKLWVAEATTGMVRKV